MVKMENKSIAILSGIFLLGAIGAFLIIPMSFQDTIILTTKNGGGPVSCLDDGALILPQNLTDLCDVTIINATSSQIIEYNGTQWVNVDSSEITFPVECMNFGSGTVICRDQFSSNQVNLKTLLNGTGIQITNTTNEIIITNTLPENTVCDNDTASGSFPLCVNNDITLRSLLAGTGISLSSNSTHITITNTAPDNTVCANVGGGSEVYKDGECNFRTIIGRSGLNVTQNTNDITLNPKYELLCQNTWSSGQSFSCSSFPTRNHLYVSIVASHANAGTGIQTAIQFNSDTGNNYADRLSVNGGADTTGTSRANCRFGTASDTEGGGTFEIEITNLATENKSLHGEGTGFLNRAVTTAPTRMEFVCNWVNTTNQITTITVMANSGNDNYDSLATITVWGYD